MAAEGSPELTPEEEKRTIRDISAAAEAQAKAGDTFYMITQRWWQEWVLFVNQSQDNATNDRSSSDRPDLADLNNLKRPSPIDNSDLISEAASEDSTIGIELLDTLVEGTDYILLPQEVWNRLYAWYGGGPILARKVIGSGQAELAVEVYPLRLHLHLMPKNEKSTIRMSKKETVGDLHQRACEIFCLTSEQVSIWDYYGKWKYALLNDMHKTLDDANIQMDQDILVEVAGKIEGNGCANQEATLVVEEPLKSCLSLSTGKDLSRNSNSGSSRFQSPTSHCRESDSGFASSSVTTRGSSSGLTGLSNLGNTCFMNSAIQCLVHTPEFARYFLDDYHKQINWHNPLGMVGELALAFGELLRKLWAPGRNPVAPGLFKKKLAKFAPQFCGNNQHDSQELLAFLLDGLHEDLNRVKHKPYKKSRDADGRPDEEVADEYWANHVARNDSIIVDVCQGQYKSTLVCPVCGKVSVTFDPFMYLSLPLPSTISRTMTVTIFTCDGSALPKTCTVNVPKQGRCRDLTQAICYACSLKQNETLVLAEVRSHQIHRIIEDPQLLLSSIKDDDHLAAYKIPNFLKNVKYLQLIHCRKPQAAGSSYGTGEWKPFGTPLLSPILCDESISRGDLQSMVHAMLSPMLRTGNMGHFDVSDSNISSQVLSQLQTTRFVEAGTKSNAARSLHKDSGSSKSSSLNELPLKLVDENNVLIDIAVGEDKAIKLSTPSMLMKVLIDWSDKLLKNYDNYCLENLPEVFKYDSVIKKARTEPINTLNSCLEAFLREEPLVPDEMWNCPQCKEQRQASKKLDLWRLPEVLVIHLKRFSYSRSMKHKLETFVNFPIHNLNLTNYVANKNPKREVFELYALINHYGGMGSGHYTAHIKLIDENRWYKFDDSHIEPINEDDVKSAAAYVLFYKRVKMDDASVSNGVLSSAGHYASSQM